MPAIETKAQALVDSLRRESQRDKLDCLLIALFAMRTSIEGMTLPAMRHALALQGIHYRSDKALRNAWERAKARINSASGLSQ